MPSEGYSQMSHDFVRACLNKVPRLRPTYGALLQHPWLAPLSKINAIAEDLEDSDEENGSVTQRMAGLSVDGGDSDGTNPTEDAEVAAWVKSVLVRREAGNEPPDQSKGVRPALHAAPLDSVSPVSSPSLDARGIVG